MNLSFLIGALLGLAVASFAHGFIGAWLKHRKEQR